jgi:zinc protease
MQLEILRAYITDPGFRPEGLRVFRRNIGPTYREIRSTWQGILRSRGWPFLYGNFGIHRFPSEEEIAARDYEELKAWLLHAFETGYLEVSVVGDFEEEALRAELDRVFGGLPGDRPEAPRHPPGPRGPRFPAGEEAAFAVESDIPQGAALVAFPSSGIVPIEESRRLSLLGSVLDDRLRLSIREDSGQAYGYQAGNRPSDTYPFGLFFGVAILTPDKVGPVAEQILDQALSLKTEPITADERERALAPTMKQLEDMRRDNNYWLRVLSGSQARPEQLEWARTLLDGFRGITLPELQETAARYLSEDRAAIVEIATPEAGEE